MRKSLSKPVQLLLVIVLLALMAWSNRSFAQCSGGTASCCDFGTMSTTFQTISFTNGYYKNFSAIAGITYKFSFCENGGTTAYDTQITILTSTGAYANGYNDDYCGTASGSQVTWTAPSTATYRVLVNDYGSSGCSASSTGSSTMAYGATGTSNDLCTNAITVTVGSTTSGTTNFASTDAPPACTVSDNSAKGVWYKVVGNGNSLKASLCTGTNYDSQMRVFSGSCGALVCVAGDDDQCSTSGPSQVTWSSVNNTTYFILINGYSGSSGNFSLAISNNAPANDLCANATTVSVGSTTAGSTTSATVDAAPTCNSVTDGTAGGVWYKVVGNGQSLTASLCTGTNYDSQIRIYTGSCGGFTCVAGNDQGCGNYSTVNWCSVSSTTYYILVHGYQANTGNFSLAISSESIPAKPTITLSGNNTETPILTSSANTGNQWYKNASIISGATSKTYTVSSEGSYTVRASAGNCPGPYSDVFAMVITGDLDVQASSTLEFFPNPVTNKITLKWTPQNNGTFEKRIMIFDMLGRNMTDLIMESNELTIDVSSYLSGQYLLKGVSGETVVNRQFIKK